MKKFCSMTTTKKSSGDIIPNLEQGSQGKCLGLLYRKQVRLSSSLSILSYKKHLCWFNRL